MVFGTKEQCAQTAEKPGQASEQNELVGRDPSRVILSEPVLRTESDGYELSGVNCIKSPEQIFYEIHPPRFGSVEDREDLHEARLASQQRLDCNSQIAVSVSRERDFCEFAKEQEEEEELKDSRHSRSNMKKTTAD